MSAIVSPSLRPIAAIAPATCADRALISCGVNSSSPNDNVGNTGASDQCRPSRCVPKATRPRPGRLAFQVGGNHIVRRQRPPNPLQLELTDWLDLHGILNSY